MMAEALLKTTMCIHINLYVKNTITKVEKFHSLLRKAIALLMVDASPMEKGIPRISVIYATLPRINTAGLSMRDIVTSMEVALKMEN